MSTNVMNFIPTRINDEDGIDSFLNRLLLKCIQTDCYENIVKKTFIFPTREFVLKYIEYKLPTEFVLVSFEFNDDESRKKFIDTNYYHIKGLIDVTNNSVYEEENINKFSICKKKFIIEGVKGVGKTTLIHFVTKYGIICLDRDMKYISNNAYESFTVEKKAKDFYRYINSSDNLYGIILMNNDHDTLINRINKRNSTNEKDLTIERYNDLSKLQTFINSYNSLERYMRDHCLINEKIQFVHCEGYDVNTQNELLYKIMKSKV